MKLFVTGVGGQLGHDVMNELLKRGHEGVGSDIQETYSGVADGSANKGSIEPQVVVQDTNLYPEGVHIFVKTGLGKDVPVEQQLIQEQTTYHYKLTNLSEMEDAIYYLTVEAEDKAGNLESLTYRYSLNRFDF